jgi:hypothetical protein
MENDLFRSTIVFAVMAPPVYITKSKKHLMVRQFQQFLEGKFKHDPKKA